MNSNPSHSHLSEPESSFANQRGAVLRTVIQAIATGIVNSEFIILVVEQCYEQ
jgi:hypothetical protein